jgi:hypothetical protein
MANEYHDHKNVGQTMNEHKIQRVIPDIISEIKQRLIGQFGLGGYLLVFQSVWNNIRRYYRFVFIRSGKFESGISNTIKDNISFLVFRINTKMNESKIKRVIPLGIVIEVEQCIRRQFQSDLYWYVWKIAWEIFRKDNNIASLFLGKAEFRIPYTKNMKYHF